MNYHEYFAQVGRIVGRHMADRHQSEILAHYQAGHSPTECALTIFLVSEPVWHN